MSSIYSIYGLVNIDKLKSIPNVELYRIYKNKDMAYEYALIKQLSYINLLDLALDTKNNGKEIFMYITDNEKTFEERLEYFHKNINKIFGKSKISGLPSCVLVYVDKKDDFDDENFTRDIIDLKEMCDE
jgi:hypothetical protein